MSKYVQALIDEIKDNVDLSGGLVRVRIKNIPALIQEGIANYILKAPRGLEADGTNFHFYFSADKIQADINKRIYTDSAVKQRNKVKEGVLTTVYEPGIVEEKSMHEASLVINKYHDLSKWYKSDLFENVGTAILKEFPNQTKLLNGFRKYAKELLKGSNGYSNLWEVIKRLDSLEIKHLDQENYLPNIFLKIGLPCPTTNDDIEYTFEHCTDIIKSIGDLVSSKSYLGLKNDLLEYIESVGLEVKREPIGSFYDYLLGSQANAFEFGSQPLVHYILSNNESADWWYKLDQTFWEGYLEYLSGSNKKIEVKVLNRIAQDFIKDGEPIPIEGNIVRLEINNFDKLQNLKLVYGGEEQEAEENTIDLNITPQKNRHCIVRFDADNCKPLTLKLIPIGGSEESFQAVAVYDEKPTILTEKGAEIECINDGGYIKGFIISALQEDIELYCKEAVSSNNGSENNYKNLRLKPVKFYESVTIFEFLYSFGEDEELGFKLDAVSEVYNWDVIGESNERSTKVNSEFRRLIETHYNEKSGYKFESDRPRNLGNLEDEALTHHGKPFAISVENVLKKNSVKELNSLPIGVPDIDIPSDLNNLRNGIISSLEDTVGIKRPDIRSISLTEIDGLGEQIRAYLSAYKKWLDKTDLASWYDVIMLVDGDQDNTNEEFRRHCAYILVSPYHPVRLAWQYRAQSIMKDCLELENKWRYCPYAAVIDPSSVAAIFGLTTSKNDPLGDEQVLFKSISSDDDYWGIYKNEEATLAIDKENTLEALEVIGFSNLDEKVSILTQNHINSSLKDVNKLLQTRSTINVLVQGGTKNNQNLTQGLSDWLGGKLSTQDNTTNLNELITNSFLNIVPTKLHVFDDRDRKLQPEEDELLHYYQSLDEKIYWYDRDKFEANVDDDKSRNYDITLLLNIDQNKPVWKSEPRGDSNLNGWGSLYCFNPLSVASITSQNNKEGKAGNIIEYYSYPKGLDQANTIENDLWAVQNILSLNTKKTQKIVRPHDKPLRMATADSTFAAVSAGSFNSGFLSASSDSYLWDFQMPEFGNKRGSHLGYYLLTSDTDQGSQIRVSIERFLTQVLPAESYDVSTVTENILSRYKSLGLPMLRNLASGGNRARGEIGLMMAMEILDQLLARLDTQEESETENSLFLTIPLDPFQNILDLIFNKRTRKNTRPDLIVLCINDGNGEGLGVKITPVEVKYRSGRLNPQEQENALDQARNFAEDLGKLFQKARESALWDHCFKNLIGSMVDFSFSTQLINSESGYVTGDEKKKIVAKFFRYLSLGNLFKYDSLDIDKYGRLITFEYGRNEDDSNYNELNNIFSPKGFDDVFLVSKQNTMKVLETGGATLANELYEQVGDWDFKSSVQGNQQQPLINKEQGNGATEKAKEEMEKENGNSTEENNFGKSQEKDGQSSLVKEHDETGGIKFKVGTYDTGFKKEDIHYWPSNTNLTQLNTGVLGNLGTGKTQLLQTLIHKISISKGNNRGITPKVLVLDTKRDYASLEEPGNEDFVKSIDAKQYKPYRLPINYFDIRGSKDENPAYTKARLFYDFLSKIYGGIGPKQETVILNSVIKSFEDAGYSSSMNDYSSIRIPTIKTVLEKYKEITDDRQDAPRSIMEKLVMSEMFETNPDKIVPFDKFFDKSVIVSLASIANLDKDLKLAMIVFLSLYRDYMLNVEKHPFTNGSPSLRVIDSYLAIDEANLVMDLDLPILEDIMLKGREFGVGVILATQYFQHFPKKYREALNTWFIHSVPDISKAQLESIGFTDIGNHFPKKIKQQGKFECLYKTFNYDGAFINTLPFYRLVEGGFSS
ncbi:ATP-binding protein [Balneolaceae bacterium YR4-1]|uniref:ATP-binding protein n=1 Tax=Halalkalibaculum roseum TaxID=2709311 RepID=A0A6M1SQN9_9BACT|nr:ATP-binding protein [Halalkalibaculum roseum]NGP75022.1 ATP-binding protein [Halalkalibaculum roseum]